MAKLLDRIKTVRRQIAQELGVIVPPLRLRDNLELKPGEYTILIKSIEVVRGELMLGHYLAMHPGEEAPPGLGIPHHGASVRPPGYLGVPLKAKTRHNWLATPVVDLPTVIITHLTEVISVTSTSC